MKYILSFLLLFTFLISNLFAQIEDDTKDSIEVYILDSYIPLDNPNSFFLSFITSDSAKTFIILGGKYSVIISDGFSENHRAEINLSNYEFDSLTISYIVKLEDKNGNKSASEVFEVDLPVERKISSHANVFSNCLFGAIIYAIPSPQLIVTSGKSSFGITKEIPILAKFSGGYNFPVSYFSIEYSHSPKLVTKNLFRIGYKQLFEIPVVEYLSIGINGFSNFNSINGVSPEISIGVFRFSNLFTVYGRYRYNFKPGDNNIKFSELSIGLFTSFLTIQY
ncbi:MAG: hypothetical protein Q8N03_05695 [Ignavibacteria bacterium]|nr:hypothetical protein [Ignavibacteria bacterium]